MVLDACSALTTLQLSSGYGAMGTHQRIHLLLRITAALSESHAHRPETQEPWRSLMVVLDTLSVFGQFIF